MDSILEFKLMLKEMMSGALKKMEGTTHSVFEKVDGAVKKTQEGLNNLGKDVKIRVDSSDVERAHGKILGLREIIEGTAIGGMIERGAEQAIDFAKQQVKDILGGGMEATKTRAQIKVMAGDEAGDALYEQTHGYIQHSMFGPELFQYEKELLGMGEKSANVLKDIQEMGDIGMADSQHMESIALALGETLSGGKYTSLQQRILRPTGFNPVAELSRATGESIQSLTQKMEDGKFTPEMFRQAMVAATSEGGRFFQMQQKMLESAFGQKKLLETNVQFAKEELGVSLMPSIGKLFKAIVPDVNALPDQLATLRAPFDRVINGFIDALPAIKAFGKGMVDVLKPIGSLLVSEGAMKLYKETLGLLTSAMGALKPIITDVTDTFRDLLPVISAVVRAASGIVDGIAISLDIINQIVTGHFKKAPDIVNDTHPEHGTHPMAAGLSVAVMPNNTDEIIAAQTNRTFGMNFGARTKKEFDANKLFNKPTAPATDASDAIVGGGKKVVNIHFRNFTEHFTIHAANMDEGAHQTFRMFEEWYLRLLQRVPA